MKQPRHHHYLSQCYLKGFTNDGTAEGQLFVIKVEDGGTFRTTPRNVAGIRDFNAVEGQPTGQLENELSKLEGMVAPALDRIIHAQSIADAGDWVAFLNLVALFAVHNPRDRNTAGEYVSELLDMVLQVALASPERWATQIKNMRESGAIEDDFEFPSYNEMKTARKNNEVKLKLTRGFHNWLELGSHKKVLDTMHLRKWSLFITKENTGTFITVDHPVCLVNSDLSPPTVMLPVGHGVDGTCLIIPISKYLLAIGVFNGNSKIVHARKVLVGRLNSVVASFAQNQVYAANPGFPFWLGRDTMADSEVLAAHFASNKTEMSSDD